MHSIKLLARHLSTAFLCITALIPESSFAESNSGTFMLRSPEWDKRPQHMPNGAFSSQTAIRDTPPSFVQELRKPRVAGGGGPGDCYDAKTLQLTYDRFSQLNWLDVGHGLFCGFKPNESVKARIKLADGKVLEANTTASQDGGIWITFISSVDQPPKDYNLYLSSASGIISSTIKISYTKVPQVHIIGSGGLALYGFQPNEQVTLLRFDKDVLAQLPDESATNKLEFWKVFRVSQDGELYIDFPELQPSTDLEDWQLAWLPYLIVGEKSGTAKIHGSLYEIGSFSKTASTATLQMPSYVVVKIDGSDTLRVRSTPNKNARVLLKVPSGVKMKVISSSFAEGQHWWYVELSSQQRGWVMADFVVAVNN